MKPQLTDLPPPVTVASVKLVKVMDGIDLPTIIKRVIFPGNSLSSLVVGTQPGIIWRQLEGGTKEIFVDLRNQMGELGANVPGLKGLGYPKAGTYDERGILGIAFPSDFQSSGLFYLAFSHINDRQTQPRNPPLSPSQIVALPAFPLQPKPVPDPETINIQPYFFEWLVSLDGHWDYTWWDNVSVLQEWKVDKNGNNPQPIRTILSVKRASFNHTGINSLIFDQQCGKLLWGLGDNGFEYDPLNQAQDDDIFGGKVLAIDLSQLTCADLTQPVAGYSELLAIYPKFVSAFTTIVKGARNPTSITFEQTSSGEIMYLSNAGQDTLEFAHAIKRDCTDRPPELATNLGFRAWEGSLVTSMELNDSFNLIPTQFAQEAITLPDFYRPFAQLPHPFADQAGTINASAMSASAFYNGPIAGLTNKFLMTNWFNEATNPGRGALLVADPDRTNLETGVPVNLVDVSANINLNSAFYYTALASQQTHLFLGTVNTSNFIKNSSGTPAQSIPGLMVNKIGAVWEVVDNSAYRSSSKSSSSNNKSYRVDDRSQRSDDKSHQLNSRLHRSDKPQQSSGKSPQMNTKSYHSKERSYCPDRLRK